MRSMIIVTALSVFCKGALAMEEAKGTFSVEMEPQEETASEDVTLGRMLLKKTFEGDLSGGSPDQTAESDGAKPLFSLRRITISN